MGLAITLCAVMITGTARMLMLPLPQATLVWLTRALAVILLLRAIGDFRLVGFWKRIRKTRFARLDTAVSSPLCLVLAIGSAIVGFSVQN
ncbi:MAG: DUF3995 domain-containing protein [Nitrospira sp.]|nr:DUF3995 domain-containing protein [Nitrospira sp.]